MKYLYSIVYAMDLKDTLKQPLVWLMLATSALSSLGFEGCQRWDCPCAGRTHTLAPISFEKRVVDIPLMARTASNSKKYTRSLLNQMERQRFRSNRDHVRSLRRCLEQRNEGCLSRYLQSCTLAGLPLLDEIRGHSQDKNLTDFLRKSRKILATIAIFLEKVRQDEARITNQNAQSLVRDISYIEESGVYHILCSMDIALKGEAFQQLASPVRCSELESQAVNDNKNYLVLHALEKYLEAVETRLEPINMFFRF